MLTNRISEKWIVRKVLKSAHENLGKVRPKARECERRIQIGREISLLLGGEILRFFHVFQHREISLFLAGEILRFKKKNFKTGKSPCF